MKRLLFIFLFGLSKPVLSQGGNFNLDTIFCDAKSTSYLVFNEAVSLIDVGNPEDYAAQVTGNLVFIKALRETIPATTVLIKSGKDIYFGIVGYRSNNKKYYYNLKTDVSTVLEIKTNKGIPHAEPVLRDPQKNDPEFLQKELSQKILSGDISLTKKLTEFEKIKNEIATLGFISSTVDAAVTVIRNDNANTFLKIVFKNKSSIPYKLDFISFQYFQDMKKGIFKKSRKAPLDVFPVAEPSIKEIAPNKTDPLAYVIPSYALSNNGYLMVLFRESSGDRVLKIKIDGSVIQHSQQLANGQ